MVVVSPGHLAVASRGEVNPRGQTRKGKPERPQPLEWTLIAAAVLSSDVPHFAQPAAKGLTCSPQSGQRFGFRMCSYRLENPGEGEPDRSGLWLGAAVVAPVEDRATRPDVLERLEDRLGLAPRSLPGWARRRFPFHSAVSKAAPSFPASTSATPCSPRYADSARAWSRWLFRRFSSRCSWMARSNDSPMAVSALERS
jgi:hypothetical protein